MNKEHEKGLVNQASSIRMNACIKLQLVLILQQAQQTLPASLLLS